MFDFLYYVSPNTFLLYVLIILSVLYIVVYYKKKINKSDLSKEGFTQIAPFVAKSGIEIYDDFYCEIYDAIHNPTTRVNNELTEIIQVTKPSLRDSVFLDVGSGTGETVYRLNQMGYRAFGIDKSESMIRISQQKYPEINVIKGDVMNPMNYEKGVFSHILCTYYTIYHIEDKSSFFQYCYSWLKPGGYLILHLENNEELKKENEQKSNVLQPCIDFFNGSGSEKGYSYEVQYTAKEKIERFTDKYTRKVRENNMELIREKEEEIIRKAKDNGFEILVEKKGIKIMIRM